MVMLLVVGVDKCCGMLKGLRICIGQRLNLIWLKLRILRLIMNTKTCCNCTYKLVFVSTNFVVKTNAGSVCTVFSYMQYCLKKQKTYLRISPKCWCFLIVVMSRMNLEMVLLWIRVGFECFDDILIPYMEGI